MGTLLDKLTAGFSRLRVGAGAFLSGDITLQAGAGTTIDTAGNTITIASSGGGGGGGVTELQTLDPASFTGPVTLAGGVGIDVYQDDGSTIGFAVDPSETLVKAKAFGQPDIVGTLTLKGGANVTLTQTGSQIEFAVPSSTAFRLRADANGYLSADTTIAAGTGVSLVQSGSTITVNGTRIRSEANGYLGGDVSLLAGTGVSLVQSGSTITVNGFALPTNLSAYADGDAMTLARADGSAARSMRFAITSTIAQGNTARSSWFDWAFVDEIGGAVAPFRIEGYGAIVSGFLVHSQGGTSKIDVRTLEPFCVDTDSTAATQVGALQPNANQCVTVTVVTQHDNGSTTGRTVYTHTYRRGATGAPVAQGSAEDLSVAAKKLGHSVTFTLVSNEIHVNVVAASATATRHVGQITWEIGTLT